MSFKVLSWTLFIKLFDCLKQNIQTKRTSERVDEFQWGFQEDVTYDNIKSHKRPGLHPFSEKYIFGKSAARGVWGSNWPYFLCSVSIRLVNAS